MNEQLQALRRQVRMVWPYRWTALGASTLLAIASWAFILYLPNVYEVSAKIFIDTRSMLRPLMQGLAINVETLSSSALLMKRTLLTRPNLEQVARKTDLDLDAANDQELDKIIVNLASNIVLSGTESDNIYEITYRDKDAKLAKRVVDELLNEFLETALGSSRVDTASTEKFLDAQIAEYEKRLLDAEERLKEFKQKNSGRMPGEGSNYFAQLEAARLALEQASLQLSEAENRRNEMKRQIEGEEPAFGMMAESLPQSQQMATVYDARIAALQNQLDQLSLQFTDKHPEVEGIKETISMLEAKRQDELKLMAQSNANSISSSSEAPRAGPFYQEVRIALVQAEAEVAALSTRVAAYKNKVQELEKSVNTVPEIEAELKRLDRDYGLNREQHSELLSRREAARLSRDVDQQADGTKLKVIEPPRIPPLPIGPPRIQYLSLALLGSLAIGAGVAFLLAQIHPRFNTSDEVKEFAKLPIIGVVSLVSSRRQQTERRMELAVFVAVLMGLFSVFGGLLALETAHFGLHDKVAAMVEKVL